LNPSTTGNLASINRRKSKYLPVFVLIGLYNINADRRKSKYLPVFVLIGIYNINADVLLLRQLRFEKI
jgi:hypothetical protein